MATLVVPLAAAARTVGVAFADLIAPEIVGGGPGTRHVFPFRLAEQPTGFARLLSEPGNVSLGLIPRHTDHRPAPTSPALIYGPEAVAAPVGAADIPFLEG